MNKPIQITSEIKDPNSLLNKFLIFKYKDNELSLSYIHKVDKINFHMYNIYFFNEEKPTYGSIYTFNIEHLNGYILQTLKNNCYYNIYTF